MLYSLDPDQARRFIGPDLGPNCLPELAADDTGRQRVNVDIKQQIKQTNHSLYKDWTNHTINS